ncbi:MAG: T9SS type A sorting domain-containing protein [bacterium]
MVVGSKVFIENHSDGIPLEPVAFALAQNYPNPFNPETTIRYSLPKKADVEIVIFNAIGQQVRVLRRENQMPGHHVLLWDGRDDYSRPVPSGVYICRLKAATMVTTRKMVLMK